MIILDDEEKKLADFCGMTHEEFAIAKKKEIEYCKRMDLNRKLRKAKMLNLLLAVFLFFALFFLIWECF